MRRILPLAALGLFLAFAGQASSAKTTLTLRLGIVQHGTTRDPHPPLGDAGDVFTTTLLMNNTVAALNRPAKHSVGAMTFTYVLHGSCSTQDCNGATADISTVSRLPGGTVTAAEKAVRLGRPPIVIPITKGTGAFQGATGNVTVGAESSPFNTYKIILP